MSETTTGQTVVRGGDVDAPRVQFDDDGREVIEHLGCRLRIVSSGDFVEICGRDGTHTRLLQSDVAWMRAPLTTYADHRTFIAPKRSTTTAPIQSAESGGLT